MTLAPLPVTALPSRTPPLDLLRSLVLVAVVATMTTVASTSSIHRRVGPAAALVRVSPTSKPRLRNIAAPILLDTKQPRRKPEPPSPTIRGPPGPAVASPPNSLPAPTWRLLSSSHCSLLLQLTLPPTIFLLLLMTTLVLCLYHGYLPGMTLPTPCQPACPLQPPNVTLLRLATSEAALNAPPLC